MEKKNKFKIQEVEYLKPYHHLVNLEDFRSYDYLYWGIEYYGYLRFILDIVRRTRNKKEIAEVGCGDGKFSIEIAKKFPKLSIEGFDLAQNAIQFAKAYSFNLNNCDFFCKDFSLVSKNYDLILTIEVLEHISEGEISSFIKNLYDNLKLGGKLIISVPTKNIPLIEKHYRHYDLNLLKKHLGNYFEISKYFFIHNENSFRYKIIRSLLINRFFILNSRFFRKVLYDYYESKLLLSNENEGSHLIAICVKK